MAVSGTAGVRALTHQEIEALACAMHSGIEPTLATSRRMLATIRELQRELVVQAQRRAEVPTAVVHAQVDSRVPDEPATIGRRG